MAKIWTGFLYPGAKNRRTPLPGGPGRTFFGPHFWSFLAQFSSPLTHSKPHTLALTNFRTRSLYSILILQHTTNTGYGTIYYTLTSNLHSLTTYKEIKCVSVYYSRGVISDSVCMGVCHQIVNRYLATHIRHNINNNQWKYKSELITDIVIL